MKIFFLTVLFLNGFFLLHSDVHPLIEKTTKRSNIIKDTSNLEYILYNDMNRLQEDTVNHFYYKTSFDDKNKVFSQISTCFFNSDTIIYTINLRIKEKRFDKKKFNKWLTQYKYLNSKIRVNCNEINIDNEEFANVKNLKIYPMELGNSSSSTVLKHYEYNHKSYFLLSGGESECNGSQCTAYQIYIITKESNNSYKFNALLFQGIFPYEFNNTFFFDKDKDGNPDLYVNKDTAGKANGKEDFNIYSYNLFGNLIKVE